MSSKGDYYYDQRTRNKMLMPEEDHGHLSRAHDIVDDAVRCLPGRGGGGALANGPQKRLDDDVLKCFDVVVAPPRRVQPRAASYARRRRRS